LLLQMFRALRPALHSLQWSETQITRSDALRWPPRNTSFRQTSDPHHPVGRLGFEIRLRRHELGLTQLQLCCLTKIHPSQLSEIERGKCLPQVSTLRKLSAVLGPELLQKGAEARLREPKHSRSLDGVISAEQWDGDEEDSDSDGEPPPKHLPDPGRQPW
jgi:transcriptional regulator with XRE-family HTH domain